MEPEASRVPGILPSHLFLQRLEPRSVLAGRTPVPGAELALRVLVGWSLGPFLLCAAAPRWWAVAL